MTRNIALYPWFRFLHGLLFWHGVWFLYFQDKLSAADAILLYVAADIAATALEVPSGYLSDRVGRRITLIVSALTGLVGAVLLVMGNGFGVFVLGQVALGASTAFVSGTDSALLYESLVGTGRAEETERQEVRAWRFSFVAAALAAVVGGGMALFQPVLPFVAGALAFAGMLTIAWMFAEPAHAAPAPGAAPQGAEIMRLASLRAAFREPVLLWLFALGLTMYVFSHIPYVFGQPFILQALEGAGFSGQAPLVRGVVSAAMLSVSVLASLIAPSLRARIGLAAILLLAFGMQIGLIAVLSLTSSAVAIGFLFLRMVPDSFSRPFILARIQPLLSDDSRATYLSLRSFAGRLLFAATLWLSSFVASDQAEMAQSELRTVLGWYAIVGVVIFAALVLAQRRIAIEPAQRQPAQPSAG